MAADAGTSSGFRPGAPAGFPTPTRTPSGPGQDGQYRASTSSDPQVSSSTGALRVQSLGGQTGSRRAGSSGAVRLKLARILGHGSPAGGTSVESVAMPLQVTAYSFAALTTGSVSSPSGSVGTSAPAIAAAVEAAAAPTAAVSVGSTALTKAITSSGQAPAAGSPLGPSSGRTAPAAGELPPVGASSKGSQPTLLAPVSPRAHGNASPGGIARTVELSLALGDAASNGQGIPSDVPPLELPVTPMTGTVSPGGSSGTPGLVLSFASLGLLLAWQSLRRQAALCPTSFIPPVPVPPG